MSFFTPENTGNLNFHKNQENNESKRSLLNWTSLQKPCYGFLIINLKQNACHCSPIKTNVVDSRGQIFISNLHDIKCEPNFELIQKNRTLVSVTEYTGATKIS